MEPCPHTLCEHIGDGKVRCQRCGAVEPMIQATIRVKAEDYAALQRLYTQCRALMQAQSATAFNDAVDAISNVVGIKPRLKLPGVNAHAPTLGCTHPDMENAGEGIVRCRSCSWMGKVPRPAHAPTLGCTHPDMEEIAQGNAERAMLRCRSCGMTTHNPCVPQCTHDVRYTNGEGFVLCKACGCVVGSV